MGQEKLPHRLQDLGQQRVAQAVIDLVAFLAALDDVLVPQHGEVLRGIGLLDADLLAQPSDRHLPVLQVLDDGDPGGVRQCPEDACLEPPHGVEHSFPSLKGGSAGDGEYANDRI